MSEKSNRKPSSRPDAEKEYEALRQKYSAPDASPQNQKGVYFSNQMNQRPVQQTPARRPSQANRQTGQSNSSAKKTNKKMQGLTAKVYILIAGILVVAALISAYALSCVNDILAMNKTTDIVTVTLSENMTTSKVVDLLHEKGLINQTLFCKLFAKVRGFEDKYNPGVYYLKGKQGLEGMLVSLKAKATSDETVEITFPEGYTAIQIVKELADQGVCDKEVLLNTLERVTFNTALVQGLGQDDRRAYRLEGYLYPDTYTFYIGENASSVIKKFLDNAETKITKADREQAEKLGMSMDEVITLASIIQKEAANKDQMTIISSILHNRLNNPAQFPLLQCDSTADYLTKYVQPNLTASSPHGISFYNDYYNTANKNVQGLPVGPICNPGHDAIQAALHPKKTDKFFFVHNTKTKKMYTARTDAEHEANKRKILNGG